MSRHLTAASLVLLLSAGAAFAHAPDALRYIDHPDTDAAASEMSLASMALTSAAPIDTAHIAHIPMRGK